MPPRLVLESNPRTKYDPSEEKLADENTGGGTNVDVPITLRVNFLLTQLYSPRDAPSQNTKIFNVPGETTILPEIDTEKRSMELFVNTNEDGTNGFPAKTTSEPLEVFAINQTVKFVLGRLSKLTVNRFNEFDPTYTNCRAAEIEIVLQQLVSTDIFDCTIELYPILLPSTPLV